MTNINSRNAEILMSAEDFRKTGYYLVDTIADFYDTLSIRPVTTGETPGEISRVLGNDPLPAAGQPVQQIAERAVDLLVNHSLFNGHPKFFGYISGAPAPVGALAELLAAGVNANVGANVLSPMATAIEKQTIRWLADFVGVPASFGGLLVSGGNMANMTAFLAARQAKASKNFKEDGLNRSDHEMVFYCSRATHTWLEKAAVLFGHGTKAIRWVPVTEKNKMDLAALEQQINADRADGKQPFLVIGNAGDVSTGVVDDLSKIAAICRQYHLWFHVDGAYGMPAAAIPEYQSMFDGIQEADSIALDPHKWLYAPLDAGCTLVKNPQHLIDTYSSHPVYYNFDGDATEPSLNYYEYGLENSRSFRALKVWMALQQVGKEGYVRMINDDIELAKLLFKKAEDHPELEGISQNLSIVTFRYLPLTNAGTNEEDEIYINQLNEKLLNKLQAGGKVFLSNALVGGKYCMRACIVNFRTSTEDITTVVDIISEEGRLLMQAMNDEKSIVS